MLVVLLSRPKGVAVTCTAAHCRIISRWLMRIHAASALQVHEEAGRPGNQAMLVDMEAWHGAYTPRFPGQSSSTRLGVYIDTSRPRNRMRCGEKAAWLPLGYGGALGLPSPVLKIGPQQ